VKFRAWRRRLALGLPTVFGLAKRGFFIPYRYASALAPAGSRPPYAALEELFEARREAIEGWLGAIDGFAAELEAIGGAPPPAPRWAQDWFPRLDGAAAYTMIRKLAPRRVVEVGCGHSTRFIARAIADGGLDCAITAIDPAPRADLDRLPGVQLLRTTVQNAGDSAFRELQAGDVLAIDSSHVLMPGSDVDMLFNRILPILPQGVFVHIHDIFLPDDYPADWEWRGYNEQLGVAALIAGAGWNVQFASHYAATRMAGRVAAGVAGRLPLPAGARESSLWLKKG
jgi:hypothetical protein